MPIIANNKYYILKANGKYYDIYNPFKTFTLTIVPTPSDATVTLTATGYTQVGNSITVRRGTTVSWSVSKNEYYTQTGTITVNKDTVQDVSLVYAMATLTIAPTPSDSTVTLTASGYTQVGNTIKVQKGTSVSWNVSKSGYVTQSGSQAVNADETKNIELEEEFTPATYRFNFTGAVQYFTVPSGCKKLIVDCVGGGALSQSWMDPSKIYYSYGGRVQCELSVTAGQTLQIYVGGTGWGGVLQNGTPPNGVGYNGGGNGLYTNQGSYWGGCGAGASDIRTSSSLNSRLVVAGGAGALDGESGGAGGGLVGGNGSGSAPFYPATGGTQTSGGAGSITTQWGTSPSGGFGYGGGGDGTSANGCIGGGGGWYGGGAGNIMSYIMTGSTSGAGGSSYTHPTLCKNVTHTQGYSAATGNGWIIITTSR